MFNKFLFRKIKEEEDFGNIWFRQEGATCHTAEAIIDVLSPVFEDRSFGHLGAGGLLFVGCHQR